MISFLSFIFYLFIYLFFIIRDFFPSLQLVQRVFETSGSNLDTAIKNLIELLSSSQGSQGRNLDSASVNDSVPIAPDVLLPSEGIILSLC